MSLLAWHFSRLNHCLSHGDGREIIPGETLSVSTPLKLCKHGLHASEDILDALLNAPADATYIWRVELSGEMVSGYGQVAAEHRKALWGFDATDVLRRFARLCALDVIHLWDAPAEVQAYLETGREELRLAAGLAAGSAVRLAAEAAVRLAAWAAKLAARGDAAEAAWAADGVAAEAADELDREAAREKQSIRLEEMIEGAR